MATNPLKNIERRRVIVLSSVFCVACAVMRFPLFLTVGGLLFCQLQVDSGRNREDVFYCIVARTYMGCKGARRKL